jgi:hypothetical protein
MFWTIVIISMGAITPFIQYVGQFKDRELCVQALKAMEEQQALPKLKALCVQYPDPPPPPPPPKPAPPSQSISSKDARK